MAPFARSYLWCICAAISVGSQCVVARFARRHLWSICGAVSVGSQCVVARFARGHLWGICAAVSLGSQCVVARFAQKHLTGICAAVSVETQFVLARFARRHLWGICATVSVGLHGTHLSTKMADSVENRVLPAVPIPSTLLQFWQDEYRWQKIEADTTVLVRTCPLRWQIPLRIEWYPQFPSPLHFTVRRRCRPMTRLDGQNLV